MNKNNILCYRTNIEKNINATSVLSIMKKRLILLIIFIFLTSNAMAVNDLSLTLKDYSGNGLDLKVSPISIFLTNNTYHNIDSNELAISNSSDTKFNTSLYNNLARGWALNVSSPLLNLSNPNQNITIEGWFSINETSTIHHIFDFVLFNNATLSRGLTLLESDGNIFLGYDGIDCIDLATPCPFLLDPINSTGFEVSNINYVDYKYHHFAIVFYNSTGKRNLKFYVDGMNINATDQNTGKNIGNATNIMPLGGASQTGVNLAGVEIVQRFTIGAQWTHTLDIDVPQEGRFFTGSIDEFRISNIDRYPNSNNFTPPTSPFSNDANTIALWHFDDQPEITANNFLMNNTAINHTRAWANIFLFGNKTDIRTYFGLRLETIFNGTLAKKKELRTNVSYFNIVVNPGNEVQNNLIFDGWIPQNKIKITKIGVFAVNTGTQYWIANITVNKTTQPIGIVLKANSKNNITDFPDKLINIHDSVGLNVTKAGNLPQRPSQLQIWFYYFEV